MAWDTSNRRKQLPPDWPAIRAAILERDAHSCQWPLTYGGICGTPANEVDHRRNPHSHNPGNLWALCHTHHARKTQREAQAAKRPSTSRLRTPETHPGKG